MRKLGALLLAAWSCAACAQGRGAEATAPARPPDVPAEAIPAGENLWMVPLAEKVEGCGAFRPVSPGRMTVAAIYYRKRGGGFTLDRREADCG